MFSAYRRWGVGVALLLIVAIGRECIVAADKPVSILAAPLSGHIHPSICRTQNGTLVVVYQGQDVLMCTRSTDRGNSWSEAKPIATTAKRPVGIRAVEKFEIYPGTVDVLPDDRVMVTWNYIADDKKRDQYYERALLYTISQDQGRTWCDQRLIGPIAGKHLGAVRHNVLVWNAEQWLLPLRVGPPQLFSHRTGELRLFSLRGPDKKQDEFQQIIRTAKGSLLALGPHLLYSPDQGRKWNRVEHFPAVPDQRDNAEGRYLTPLTDGRVLVTWGVGHDNRGLSYNLSLDDGRTWKSDRTRILLPHMEIAARYYSARTIQLDEKTVGTVFMNRSGIYFLPVRLERFRQ